MRYKKIALFILLAAGLALLAGCGRRAPAEQEAEVQRETAVLQRITPAEGDAVAVTEAVEAEARSWAGACETKFCAGLAKEVGGFVAGELESIPIGEAIGLLLLAEEIWQEELEYGRLAAAYCMFRQTAKDLGIAVGTEIGKSTALKRLWPAFKSSATLGLGILHQCVMHLRDYLFFYRPHKRKVHEQIKAYLTWRGWFFTREGRWIRRGQRLDHKAVLTVALYQRPTYTWKLLDLRHPWLRRSQQVSGFASFIPCYPSPPVRPNGLPAMLLPIRVFITDELAVLQRKKLFAGAEFKAAVLELVHPLPGERSLQEERQWLKQALQGANTPPIVSAGRDQTVNALTEVTLSGSAVDHYADILTFRWVQEEGPEDVALYPVAEYKWKRTFIPEKPGHYVFQLDVSDGLIRPGKPYSSVRVTIIVEPALHQRPIAIVEVRPNLEVAVNTMVTLDGSGSYDPEHYHLTFRWSQVYGRAIALSDPAAIRPTFTPTIVGTYTFQLVVNDGKIDSEPVEVVVRVKIEGPQGPGGIPIPPGFAEQMAYELGDKRVVVYAGVSTITAALNAFTKAAETAGWISFTPRGWPQIPGINFFEKDDRILKIHSMMAISGYAMVTVSVGPKAMFFPGS